VKGGFISDEIKPDNPTSKRTKRSVASTEYCYSQTDSSDGQQPDHAE
jgi:hypothetical protein